MKCEAFKRVGGPGTVGPNVYSADVDPQACHTGYLVGDQVINTAAGRVFTFAGPAGWVQTGGAATGAAAPAAPKVPAEAPTTTRGAGKGAQQQQQTPPAAPGTGEAEKGTGEGDADEATDPAASAK